MSAPGRRGRRSPAVRAVAGGALLVLVGAEPAAAHAVDNGAMPAPPWLLAYLGAFAVLATALTLRARYPRSRNLVPVAEAPSSDDPEPRDAAPDPSPPAVGPGNVVGLVLLVLVVLAGVIGPDSGAGNIAPVAVLIVWWIGLPLLSLVVGDVMRALNPFVAVVRLLERATGDRRRPAPPPPSWVPAALLAAFAWFFVAYHRPGSPRAVAVLVVAYTLVAVAAGLRWGSRWLVTGEGFGALSAALSAVAPMRRSPAPPGTAAVVAVWLASVVFDALLGTPFFEDAVGDRLGWSRTLVLTVGYAWTLAIVAAAFLGALRLGDRTRTAVAAGFGVVLVPLAAGWFVGHDLTLLLFEGQNFIALLSDPIGRGWDLLGTISQRVDYGLARAAWVPWVQVLAVLAGHVGAVVVAHDRALALLPRRSAAAASLALAAAAAASVAAAAMLVLG